MSAADRPGPLSTGDRVGNLVIERTLGHGGFAQVYLATDEILGRAVALKILDAPPGDDGAANRSLLLSEARMLGAVQSPYVVTIHQVRTLPDGRLTIEMEYIEGGTLADAIAASGSMSPARVAAVLRDVLRGLDAAHLRGVLHRDVKPGNVLLARDGTAKLADFGLARLSAEAALRSSQAGRVAGTPVYMAPEILLRAADSTASDLWSVGVMAHEMLTGRAPFEARDLQAFFHAVLNDAPPPLDAELPTGLRRLVARCLTKRPEDRANSCAELLPLLDEGVREAAEPARERPAVVADTVGRAAEMEALTKVLDRAAAGRFAAAFVTGDSGSGKSSLLRSLQSVAAQRGFHRLSASLAPQEAPVAALLRAVRAMVRTESGHGPTAAITAAAGPRGSRYLAGEEIAELSRSDEAVALAESLLRALAKQGPVLLTIDDLRHSSADDATVLVSLAARLEDTRVALVAAHRPDDPAAARLGEIPESVHVELGPLPDPDIYEVLLRASGTTRIHADSVREIVDRAGGNPFLALQLLAHLEAQGALARVGSELVTTGRPAPHDLPAHLRDVIAARLAALPAEQQEMLEVAAVDGDTFDGQAVAAALEMQLLVVLRTLQRICVAGGLAAPSAAGYRFASPLVREVLLGRLSPEMRAELHRRLAAHLEARPGRVDANRLATHLQGCGEVARSLPHAIRAATEAAARWDIRRGWALLQAAGVRSESLDPAFAYAHAEILFHLTSGMQDRNETPVATDICRAIAAGATAAGDRRIALRAEFRIAVTAYAHSGASGVDEVLVRRALEEFPGTPLALEAHYVLALEAKRRSSLDEAESHLRATIDPAAGAPTDYAMSRALDQLGSIARRRGRYAVAEEHYRESARLAERLGRPTLAAMRQVNRATCAIVAGNVDNLEPALVRAIRALEIYGGAALAAQARINLAEIRLALGDCAEAERVLTTALPVLRSSGRWIATAAALTLLAALVGGSGRTEEALAALDEADAIEAKAPDAGLAVQTLVARARVECLAGRNDAGTAACVRALRLSAGSQEVADSVVGGIALAVIYGADPQVLEDGIRALGFDATSVPAEGSPASFALVLGARGLRAGDADQMDKAARLLRGPRIGSLRAELRAIGSWLEAESARRTGDARRASVVAERGVREAQAIGHVRLERRNRLGQ